MEKYNLANSNSEKITEEKNHAQSENVKIFAVIRDDERVIKKFDARIKALAFSDKLNRIYIENGLNTNSKVIEIS